MQLDDYQYEAGQYAAYLKPMYPFLALAEEAGEVAGKVAKIMRGDEGPEFARIFNNNPENLPIASRNTIIAELGDVLWQVQQCCTELGFSLEDVANQNLTKLADRKARNVIKGNGDAR